MPNTRNAYERRPRNYDILWLDDQIRAHGYIMQLLPRDSEEKYFSYVKKYFNSDVRALIDSGSLKQILYTPRQLIWHAGIPDDEIISPLEKPFPSDSYLDIMNTKHMGNIYALLNWKYGTSGREMMEKLPPEKLFDRVLTTVDADDEKIADGCFESFF